MELSAREGWPTMSVKVTTSAGYVFPSAGSRVGMTDRVIPVATVGGVLGSAEVGVASSGIDPMNIRKSRATARGALFPRFNMTPPCQMNIYQLRTLQSHYQAAE